MAGKMFITIWGCMIFVVIWICLIGFHTPATAETMNLEFITML